MSKYKYLRGGKSKTPQINKIVMKFVYFVAVLCCVMSNDNDGTHTHRYIHLHDDESCLSEFRVVRFEYECTVDT